MPAEQARSTVPYFSQWESAHLAADFISGKRKLTDEPNWRASGAGSIEEYARWANHICGMACFRMVLAARTGAAPPSMELTRAAVESGAYVIREDGSIHGLIYAPFVKMAQERHGIAAEVVTGIGAADLAGIMTPGALFIASVHPTVRWLRPPPPRKGGHLVLVTAASDGGVVFHNPSGDTEATQEDAVAPVALFDEFFAGRGILLPPP